MYTTFKQYSKQNNTLKSTFDPPTNYIFKYMQAQTTLDGVGGGKRGPLRLFSQSA